MFHVTSGIFQISSFHFAFYPPVMDTTWCFDLSLWFNNLEYEIVDDVDLSPIAFLAMPKSSIACVTSLQWH